MSEYRRFVSYIYEYQRGRKKANCGFVKVEVRSGLCRLRLHLQPAGRTKNPLRVYAFIRQEEKARGIFLGNVSAQNNHYEFQADSAASSIGGSAYSIRDVRGLWLRGADEENYITIWDEEPVEVETFSEVPAEPDGEHGAENFETIAETAGAGHIENMRSAGAENMENGEDRAVVAGADEAAAEHDAENFETAARNAGAGHIENMRTAEAGHIENMRSAGAENMENGENRAVVAEADEADGEHDAENFETAARNAGTGHIENMRTAEEENVENMRSAGAEGMENEEDRAVIAGAEAAPERAAQDIAQSGSLYRRWEQFLNHYPRIEPFADNEITQCICIAPKDLSFLQREEWHFSRSTFVRQAYQQYHHLMLGCHRSGRFVLAVPGSFRDMQEKHMAGMYGFPYYKETAAAAGAGEVRAADGRIGQEPLGYWYHFLNEECPAK